MILHGISIPEKEIGALCRRHGVKTLSLFGSILRDDFGPQSDVDILVEFQPGVEYSLLDLGGMLVELEEMLGRHVDLKTPGFISDRILPRIRADARRLYAA